MKRGVSEVYAVGVTGSMGSGKSEAVRWFRNRGYTTMSADKIGHELLEEPDIIQKLSTVLGKEILTNKRIDRSKLGKVVFNEPEKLKLLNEILHPLIISRIDEVIKNSEQKIIIFEVPLLFEAEIENLFDLTVNIAAAPVIRRERIYKRDYLSRDEIEHRFSRQLADETKRERADITIVNNGDLEEFYGYLKELEKDLLLNIG